MKKVIFIYIFAFLTAIIINSCSKDKEEIIPIISKQRCESQIKLIPQALKQLYNAGVNSNMRLKLKYYFYTTSEIQAKNLSRKLDSLNYSSVYKLANGSKREFVITGYSLPIKMDENSIKEWTLKMCNLGISLNCDFDGWQTSPNKYSK